MFESHPSALFPNAELLVGVFPGHADAISPNTSPGWMWSNTTSRPPIVGRLILTDPRTTAISP